MKKFKLKSGDEFESGIDNDVLAVLVAIDKHDKPLDDKKLQEIKDKWEKLGHKVYSYDTTYFSEEKGDLLPKTFYYVGAEAVEPISAKYKPITDYDNEIPPKEPVIEITLQCGEYKKIVYKEVKNYNCDFLTLVNMTIDDINEDLINGCDSGIATYVEEREFGLKLYTEGGWELSTEFEIKHSGEHINPLISSIRLMEKVK